ELDYDDLGRVRSTKVAVGAAKPVETLRSWSVTPLGVWQCDIAAQHLAWTTSWREILDTAERLVTRTPTSSTGPATTFAWIGNRYVGRRQPQPGWASPFTEAIE